MTKFYPTIKYCLNANKKDYAHCLKIIPEDRFIYCSAYCANKSKMEKYWKKKYGGNK